MSIPVCRPTLRRKDLNNVLSCLVSDRIGPGQLGAELAGELSRQIGASGGACLSSYSAAIERVLDALQLAPGDSLAVSALTPSIYRSACARRGVHTVIVDVDRSVPLLDAAAMERLLTSGRTAARDGAVADGAGAGSPEPRLLVSRNVIPKALVLHHTLGFVPENDDILRLGIPVVEDFTHALGGFWNGGPCGSHGQFAVLSLQPDGIITAGAGGAVFARDRKAARNLASVRGSYDQDQMLPDMNAALGLSQLKELQRFLRARQDITAAYLQSIAPSRHGALASGMQATGGRATVPQEVTGETRCVPYGFAVTVKGGLKEVRQYAAKRGVETRIAFADTVLAVQEGEETAGADEPAGTAGGQGTDRTLDGPRGSSAAGPLESGVGALSRGFPRAYELLLGTLQFPLYPTLARKDVQLIAKVLATLP